MSVLIILGCTYLFFAGVPTALAQTADTGAVVAAPVVITQDLYLGYSGPEVSILQQFLKAQGFFTYPSITEYFGPATEAALKAFQVAHGIEPVGQTGPQTRAQIRALAGVVSSVSSNTSFSGSTSNFVITQDLYLGYSGPEVSILQQFLKAQGFFTYPSITEYFGPATEAALKAFQVAHGIEPVGQTGPQTRAQIVALGGVGGVHGPNDAADAANAISGACGSVACVSDANIPPPNIAGYTPGFGGGSRPTSSENTVGASVSSDEVAVVNPAPGSILSGSVAVSATAAASSSVAEVSFYIDGALAYAATTSPYGFAWDSTASADGAHSLAVVVRDGTGAYATTTVAVATDNTPPAAPTGLYAGVVTGSSATLSWNAAADAVGVSYYAVYRGGNMLATTSALTYTDSGLTASTTYSYSVLAFDAVGHSSAASTALSVTTPNAEAYDWQPLRIGAGGWIVGMDIASDGTMVIRTDTGAGGYIWNGSEWVQLETSSSMPSGFVAPGGGQNVYALRIAPTNTSRLYMARGGYVFRSDNKGATWTQTSFPFSSMPVGNFRMMGSKMAIDPRNEDVVYVATPAAGAWRTTDAGVTWTHIVAIPSAVDSDGNMPVAFDPTSGTTGDRTDTIYIGSEGNGIYESSDAGQTWALIPGSATTTDHLIVAQNGVMYYTDHNTVPNNVWKYADGTLTQLPTGTGFYHSIAVDPSNPDRIVIGSNGGGIEQSLDGGATWTSGYTPTRAAADIPWLAWTAEGYMSNGNMMFNPTNGELYFAEGIGVWETALPTSPAPITWTSQSYGIEQLVSNEIIDPPGGEPLVASWDRGVFYSADPNVFPVMHGPNRNTSIRHGWALDWASSDPSTIVGIFNLGVAGGASGYSNDGGQTWQQFATVPNGVDCCGGDIAASSPTNFVWVYSNNGNAYYTQDGGQTWATTTMPGVPTSGESGWGWAYYFDRHIVAADRVLSNTFYAYNYGPTQAPGAAGIFKSTDGGTTWTQVYSGSIGLLTGYHAKLRSVPGEAGNLFFTAGLQGDGGTTTPPTCCGFYQSTDGGATWSEIPNVVQVWDMGFGKSATPGGYPAIYIVGWVNNIYGIWRSDDDAQTWVQIGNYPVGNIDIVKAIAGDMNIYGRVYIGFGGSGYAYGDQVVTSTSPYTLRVYSNSHGSISPDTTAVAAGGSQTFSITPDSGYYIAHVYVDGADQGALTSYTFSNVDAPHTISVIYNAISPPDTPSSFSAVSASTSVALSWGDVATEDNYVIERSTSMSSGFSPIATTSANVTSYTDWGLGAGVYYYRLKATNAGGASAYTATVPGVACGSCEAPSSGLVGYWPLDGNANDASGNNENGTLVGSTTTFVSGRISEAASFTGDSGNYINMGDLFDSLDQSITLSAWVKVAGTFPDGVSGSIMGKDSNSLNTKWLLDVENSSYGSHVYTLQGSLSPSSFASTGTVPTGIWTLVTYTWDGSTESIYLNGILDSQASSTGSLVDPNSLPFHIGFTNGFGNGNSYFNGLIDDVRVYDRALSPTEVAELYGFSGQ